MEVKKSRNSNIELLRILMMLQIIFLHVSEYGEYSNIASLLEGKTELIYWVLWLMCRCPVFVFIIIMGYFLSETKTDFNRKRMLKAYLPMYFYSLAIPFVYGIFRPEEVTDELKIKAFIPFLSRTWYFMTLYLLVLILSPYLNKMVRGLTRNQFLGLLGICFFMLCIWQPLSMLEPFEGIIGLKKILSTQGGKSLYDFIFMYLLGAFMRRYHIFSSHNNESDNMWNKPFIYLVGFLLLGLINVFIVYKYPDDGIDSVIGYNDNPLVVLQCTCIFRFFEKLDFSRYERAGRIINYISIGNLGVYMIHEHPLLRHLIWDEIFTIDIISFYTGIGYLFKIIGIILVIYIACWSIDWIRRMLAALIKKAYISLKGEVV